MLNCLLKVEKSDRDRLKINRVLSVLFALFSKVMVPYKECVRSKRRRSMNEATFVLIQNRKDYHTREHFEIRMKCMQVSTNVN